MYGIGMGYGPMSGYQQQAAQSTVNQQKGSIVSPLLLAGGTYGLYKFAKSGTGKLYTDIIKSGLKEHNTRAALGLVGSDMSTHLKAAKSLGGIRLSNLMSAGKANAGLIKSAYDAGVHSGGGAFSGLKSAASAGNSIMKEGFTKAATKSGILGKVAGWFAKGPTALKVAGAAIGLFVAYKGIKGSKQPEMSQANPYNVPMVPGLRPYNMGY